MAVTDEAGIELDWLADKRTNIGYEIIVQADSSQKNSRYLPTGLV
jgi:hypothetical protein